MNLSGSYNAERNLQNKVKVIGMGANTVINSNNIVGLIQRTLNEVDTRLIDHGIRVAFLVSRMLEADGSYSRQEKQDICILSALHDIGAYKTEEIDRMVEFETGDVWEHSIYGYVFLCYLSPLKEWSEAVLFHHTPAKKLPRLEPRIKEVAQMISLADRMEIFSRSFRQGKSMEEVRTNAFSFLEEKRGIQYTDQVIDLFIKAEKEFGLFAELQEEDFKTKWILMDIVLTERECEQYLGMLIYAIDFRSQHTVTHTITTTSISCSVAQHMNIIEEKLERIRYGAMLHDLGKIGIPVEILEFPGKLSTQAMNIMRTHVDITERILGDSVASDVSRIALRHHEKLDGSGYPRGIEGKDMTLEEEIVAASDIVSALLGTRSYKEAFSKERTLSIIQDMAENGKLNPEIISVIQRNFDEIVGEAAENCAPALENYYGIQLEYRRLLVRYLV